MLVDRWDIRVNRRWILSLLLLQAGVAVVRADEAIAPGDNIKPDPPPPLHFFPTPDVLSVADVDATFTTGAVTDLAAADFDGDGITDLAVAWFATGNVLDPAQRLRRVTILRGDALGDLDPLAEFDLHVPDPFLPSAEALYSFRNGTSELATGDFDGDGDADLAALPFFGDELWFFENLGGGQFAGYLRFMFGTNSPGFFTTSPEAASADFDGDGRDELVYVADALTQWDGALLHFWRTSDSIANMQRTLWGPDPAAAAVGYTRSLALGDLDDDGRPDLAFSGAANPFEEADPVFVVWHALNLSTQRFSVLTVSADFLISDMAAVQGEPGCPPHIVLGDLNVGDRFEPWLNDCDQPPAFAGAGAVTGLAGLSPDRGVVLATGDLNGDGLVDLVAKQRTGSPDDADQVQVALGRDTGEFAVVDATLLDTTGFQSDSTDQILRPNALVVADLFGNRLPEIVAAFRPPFVAGSSNRLDIVLWRNGCLGDVNRDGLVNLTDVTLVLQGIACNCTDDLPPDVDLNRDGNIDLDDLTIVAASMNCQAPQVGLLTRR